MKSKRLLKNAVAFLSVIVLALVAAICVQGYTVSAEDLTTDDEQYTYQVSGGEVTITGYVGDGGDIVIPSTIDGKPVTAIGDKAFYECESIANVVVSEGITSIGESAFEMSSLESIDLPSTLTSIGKAAFSNTFLISIEIPNGVTSIEEVTFFACIKLESITFPETLTSIGSAAFFDCWKLKNITIPKSVTSIEERAFENFSYITIYCYKDSYADMWAMDFPYTVVYLDDDTDTDTESDSIPTVSVTYHTHIQTYGDTQGTKKNGQMAGTSGESKRLENIWIKVDGNANLGVQYSTHCQTYGWMPWSCNGETIGTSGEAKRLEAIKIQLTGADKDKYDIYYRVHAQSYGWLGWAKNGEPSGTAGYAKRLEGIQVVVVKKGEAAPGLKYAGVDGSSSKYNNQAYVDKNNATIVIPGDVNAPIVSYKTHVQSFGWQKWVYNGAMSGTEGKAKRLEGINIKVTNCPYDGDIVYTTHVQKYGWKDGKPEDTSRSSWKKNGEMSGTSGEAKRLEAICIDLTGQMGEKYDVYYRVHAQSYGWLGWAKNGECSGTAGYAKRLEGIQVVLVPKGGAAPANDFGGITSVQDKAYIEKK